MGEEQGRTGEGKGQVLRPCVWKELGVLEEEREGRCGSKMYGGE